MAISFVVYGTPVCASMYVSTIGASGAVSLALFLLFSCLFVLSFPGLLVFILFDLLFLGACFLRRKRVWILVGREVGEGSGRSWQKGNHNQNIYYEKNLFSILKIH